MSKPLVTAKAADSDAICALSDTLCAAYPFLQRVVIGQSVCGRKIEALSIGHGRHAVLFAAAFHGQEWITSLVALRLCEDLCRLYTGQDKPDRVDFAAVAGERMIVIVPQVNPDGVNIALNGSRSADKHADFVRLLGGDIPGLWQANANGVDINHNFNAGWQKLQEMEQKNGIYSAGPRQWGGLKPESEPETAALCALCRRLPFAHVAALHTQGEEIYWQYGDRTPPQARMTARLLGAFSGYRVSDPDGLASHGGFKDWFIDETGHMGFTFELGRGVNPLPLDAFEPIYRKARNMLLLTAVL